MFDLAISFCVFLLFFGCRLTSIKLPRSVTFIGDCTFYDCRGLTSVTIPNSVTSIGSSAFQHCSGLTSVTIPNSVTSIGSSAFQHCSGLTSIVSEIENPIAIDNNAFGGIPSNTTLIVPRGKTSIYHSTAGWSNFTNIVELGEGGFAGCRFEVDGLYYTIRENNTASLTSANKSISGAVTIPGQVEFNGKNYSVTSISESAFQDCTGLTSVAIPNSVTSIGSNAFSGCSSLNAVRISDLAAWCNIDFLCDEGKYDYLSNPLVYANHLYLNDSKVEELVIPDGVTEIKSGAFSMGKDITSLKIPNSVTSIGDNCFQYSNLSSLEIPNGVTYVGYGSFKFNQNMTSVTIPNSVTFIGGWAFGGCKALTSVAIPNSVTEILDYTFESCTGLNSVIIPSTVTSISVNAFQNCNSLEYICLSSENYPSTQSLGTTSCQYIMPQTAFDGGIPQDITNYATYSVAPKYIKVKSTTATTATLELTPINISGGNSESATSYEVTMCDLKPGSPIVGSWKWDTYDHGIVSIPTAMTKNLVMNVQPAQALSTTKARLLATVNEADDGKHYGFEWLRNDAPDNMTPKKVSAPLDNGKIIGTLSGLNPDIYYKYRPFYKADDGTVFVGEWEAFLTGDANVTFDPEVHTKEPVALSDGKMILLLFCAEGTEEILEKGFELIRKAIESLGTRADGGDITTVIVNGNEVSATIEGLEPGTEYICRSYVKTASGTTYGEEVTFKTPLPGDANNDDVVNAADIVEIVNTKSGNPSASFNMTNADMDGNGKLTEADINAIVSKIMQK